MALTTSYPEMDNPIVGICVYLADVFSAEYPLSSPGYPHSAVDSQDDVQPRILPYLLTRDTGQ